MCRLLLHPSKRAADSSRQPLTHANNGCLITKLSQSFTLKKNNHYLTTWHVSTTWGWKLHNHFLEISFLYSELSLILSFAFISVLHFDGQSHPRPSGKSVLLFPQLPHSFPDPPCTALPGLNCSHIRDATHLLIHPPSICACTHRHTKIAGGDLSSQA